MRLISTCFYGLLSASLLACSAEASRTTAVANLDTKAVSDLYQRFDSMQSSQGYSLLEQNFATTSLTDLAAALAVPGSSPSLGRGLLIQQRTSLSSEQPYGVSRPSMGRCRPTGRPLVLTRPRS